MPLRLLLFAFSLAALAEEWTRFRGPNGSGVSGDSGYPVEFSRGKNMLWRTPVRPGKSSPVLTRDRIYLTAAEGRKLYTLCHDRKSGGLLWERAIEQPRTEIQNRLNHHAAITPVTDGENVYVFFKDFGLVSYDRQGRERWATPLGPFKNTQGLSSSPILAGGSLILVADQWEDSFIAAYDPATGKQRWKVLREEGEGWGTPLTYQGTKILTASRGQFGIHEAESGRRTATLRGIATTIVGSPILSGGTFYAFGYGSDEPPLFETRLTRLDKNGDGVLTADEFGEDPILNNIARNIGNRDGKVTAGEWDVFAKATLGPNALMAIRVDGGAPRELWRYVKNFTSVIPSLLDYGGALWVARNGGILTTHEPSTGEVVKAARMAGAPGGYSSSPVGAEGRVYLGSEEGKVVVLRARPDWEVIQVNDLGEGVYATPALSGGVIYLRTEEALYAFGGGAVR